MGVTKLTPYNFTLTMVKVKLAGTVVEPRKGIQSRIVVHISVSTVPITVKKCAHGNHCTEDLKPLGIPRSLVLKELLITIWKSRPTLIIENTYTILTMHIKVSL